MGESKRGNVRKSFSKMMTSDTPDETPSEKMVNLHDGHVEKKQETLPSFSIEEPKGELSSIRSWIYMIIFPCTTLITWGIISAFPVLFVAFLEKFQKSRSETSTIGSLQVGLLYMLAVIPGYLIPLYGFRIILISGCLITAIGFISSIFVSKMYLLYITMGVITSLGASTLLTVVDSAPLFVFSKWRTLATILSSTSGSLGFAIIPLTVSYLLHTYALNGTLLLLAGIVLQCVVLGMLYPSQYKLTDQPEKACTNCDIGADHDINTHNHKRTSMIKKYVKLIKSPSFWCLAAAGLAIDALSNGCRVFLVDRAILQGIPESKAVLSISLWGIFSAVCKLFVQIPCINKTPRRKQIVLVIVTFCWSLVTLVSVAFSTYEGFLLYCVLAGVCHGVNSLLWYLILADVMDRELLVPAYSVQCFIAGPFVMFSVPIAGLIYDSTQSYDVPYIMYGCIGMFGAICESLIPYFERRKARMKKEINSPSYPGAA